MSEKRPEDVLGELDSIDVTELDDKELDAVSGGMSDLAAACVNGNCNGCSSGDLDPNGCTNSNCTPAN